MSIFNGMRRSSRCRLHLALTYGTSTSISYDQPALDDPKVLEQQVQSIPWKRAAEPEEIAKLALYLASEDASYASGQTFTLDGGLMMNQGQGA